MLHELRVRNLLLIDLLEIKLEPGFNVMTGETGAGKSVVIGALKLVLGGRAVPDQIRPGASEAEVEALFDINAPDALERLRLAGTVSNDELVVRRTLHPSARSRAYLNGRLSAVSELAQLAPHLADIASQHESVSLTDVSTHIGYLDAFGELDTAREQVGALVAELNGLRTQLARLREVTAVRAEREDFLRFQLNSIEEAEPKAGEVDALKAERARLRNTARLSEAAGKAASQLSNDDGLCDHLRAIVGDLTSASEIDPALAECAEMTRSALDQLVEAGRSLERYVDGLEAEPSRLDEIEHRLYQLEQLLRRHGPTEVDALAAADRLRDELGELDQVDDTLRDAERGFEEALGRAGKLAFALSKKRTKSAKALAEGISQELAALGMGGARVCVDVARHVGDSSDLVVNGAKLTADGVDRVEFLIAPNKGIAPRPLRKIASGGELSRSLLAIKRILASQGPAGLYVFDEVDAGVGGAVAERIGQALADIAKHRQVLCITHLAPIAALADAHFVVRKSQSGNVARTDVVRVTGQERVQEIARMLSGKRVTSASMQTANEMIEARH
jgi:DNA repair protein RecN (Recombination protein N)